MRISDWSSDVCSSDLTVPDPDVGAGLGPLILLAKAQSFLTGQGRRRHGAKADVVAVVDVDHRKTSLRRSWTASKKRASDWYSAEARSEESRVGKECVSTGRSRWSPYH